jgi:Na+/serine symporter
MYDGPQSGLVKANIVVGCLALAPVLLVILYVVGVGASKVVGDYAMIPAVIVMFLLLPIAGAPFLVIIPFLFALIFLLRLLRSEEIPPHIKKKTSRFVIGSLLVMFVSAGLLHLVYRANGNMNGLFH